MADRPFYCGLAARRPSAQSKSTPGGAPLHSRGLGAADLDGVGPLGGVRDLEAHLVAFAELVELNVRELVGVEKEIFFPTFDFDEAEALVGKTGDSSFLHGNEKIGG